jgi:hypothetical protein
VRNHTLGAACGEGGLAPSDIVEIAGVSSRNDVTD